MAVAGISRRFPRPSPTAIVGDVARGHHGGSVVAGFQMMSDVGRSSALVAGLLLDAAGFHIAFSGGAVVTALALLLAIRMPETPPKGTAGAAA